MRAKLKIGDLRDLLESIPRVSNEDFKEQGDCCVLACAEDEAVFTVIGPCIKSGVVVAATTQSVNSETGAVIVDMSCLRQAVRPHVRPGAEGDVRLITEGHTLRVSSPFGESLVSKRTSCRMAAPVKALFPEWKVIHQLL